MKTGRGTENGRSLCGREVITSLYDREGVAGPVRRRVDARDPSYLQGFRSDTLPPGASATGLTTPTRVDPPLKCLPPLSGDLAVEIGDRPPNGKAV